jgi:hypothetical protein
VAEAERNGAPKPVLDSLGRLPVTTTYATVYDVWEALGGTIEHTAGRRDRHGAGGKQ